MNRKPQHKPHVVQVRDRYGDELPLPRLAQELVDADRASARAQTVREDLQAARRRPLDAPMATRDPEPDDYQAYPNADYRLDTVVARFGARWAVLTLLCMVGSFVVGFFTGRSV